MLRLANMITQINAGYGVKRTEALVPYSQYTLDVLRYMAQYNFVSGVVVGGFNKNRPDKSLDITVSLTYRLGRPFSWNLRLVSRASRRIY
jgi:ribosomal protein S8